MDKAFEITSGTVVDLPLKLVDLDTTQPRKAVDEDYLVRLSQDIRTQGVLQPITVRPTPEQPGRFTIVYGECRYRASKMANKKTIPVILDTTNKDDLDRLLNQVKENYHRRDLNPIELANVLKRLRDEFSIKSQAKIEATLKEHGITDMSQSYISNTIRLLDLPQWAIDLITTGTLTASHGKYLFPAVKSEKVIEYIKEVIDGDPDITTAQLRDKIFEAYGEHHEQLTNNEWRVKFDYREECVKSGCQKIRKVSGFAAEDTFCLDEDCFEEKNQRAKEERHEREEERNAEPKEVTISDDNTVDAETQELREWVDYKLIINAEFDEQECFGCKDCHQVKRKDASGEEKDLQEACFNLECWDEKASELRKAEEQHRKIERTVMQDIAVQLAGFIVPNHEQSLRLLAWCSSVPDGIRIDDDEEFITEGTFPVHLDIEDTEKALFSGQLVSLSRFLDATPEQFQQYTAHVISELNRRNLLELSKRYEVKPENYRVNDAYLAHKTIAQLCDLLQEANVIDDSIRADWEKKPLPDVFAACVQDANIIGLPDDVAEVYREVLGGGE